MKSSYCLELEDAIEAYEAMRTSEKDPFNKAYYGLDDSPEAIKLKELVLLGKSDSKLKKVLYRIMPETRPNGAKISSGLHPEVKDQIENRNSSFWQSCW